MASSQVIRYTGHYDFANEGKFLWEILCQLRNFGIGRYVTKNEWRRKFPDHPSYLKIVSVRPEMDRWLSRGQVFGEWTFRGHNFGIFEFTIETNRSDWKLIHKHEEKELLKSKNKLETFKLPDSFPLPPLIVHARKEVAQKLGKKWNEAQSRAPLDLCIDPQFEIYRPFIKQVKPKKLGKNPYEETDPNTILDMWGAELPARVDSWNSGRAEIRSRFIKSKLNELTENTEERNVDFSHTDSELKFISDK